MGIATVTKESFLSLVRLGIGHVSTIIPDTIDWEAIRVLASEQGLSAVILDGAQVLMGKRELVDGRRMEVAMKKQWIGNVILNYEQKYEDYRKQIGRLARFYNEHGFRLMILKGYGLSLNYPIPQHRPCGDIDIWAFGQYLEADSALSRDLGIEIDKSHHHHTVFHWKDYLVENHYDWVNVYAHRSSAELEKLFKELAMDGSNSVKIDGQTVYLPVPNLHALFILRHTMSHFVSTSMSIRQLLDWGFFVEKHSAEIDWDWLVAILDRFHMKLFFTCLNAICVADLGFEVSLFPPMQIDLWLKDRILNDMLSPEFSTEQPSDFFKRILFKYRRWQANGWKHDLCYKESRFVSFFTGLWAHFLKPSSF